MAKSITVKLSEELSTHAGPKHELMLNEPRAKSFRKGEPFKMQFKDGNAIFDYNNEIVLAFLVDMTGIDAVILDNLSATDFMRLRAEATSLILGIAGDRPTVPQDGQLQA